VIPEHLLTTLSGRILGLKKASPVLVGIDGVDGSGKSMFAAHLTDYFRSQSRQAIHSSVDYFHHPRQRRHRDDKPSHMSYFEDSFNYDALKAKLLDPLTKRCDAKHCILRHFDHRIDSEVSSTPIAVADDLILIFDGIFLHRDEIRHYWDFSIWLDVPFEITYQRMSSRDGCSADPNDARNQRWLSGQRHYLETCIPQKRASIVIDNSDFDDPKIIRLS
jgi:uridine kinase